MEINILTNKIKKGKNEITKTNIKYEIISK